MSVLVVTVGSELIFNNEECRVKTIVDKTRFVAENVEFGFEYDLCLKHTAFSCLPPTDFKFKEQTDSTHSVFLVEKHDQLMIAWDVEEYDCHIVKTIGECVEYWNRCGRWVYEQNKSEILGNSESQEFARRNQYDFWLLTMIASDMRTIIDGKSEHFTFGRGGNHVWLHFKDERQFIIHLKPKEVEEENN